LGGTTTEADGRIASPVFERATIRSRARSRYPDPPFGESQPNGNASTRSCLPHPPDGDRVEQVDGWTLDETTLRLEFSPPPVLGTFVEVYYDLAAVAE